MRTVTTSQFHISEGCETQIDIPVSSIEDILEMVSIVIPASEGPSPDSARYDLGVMKTGGGEGGGA